MTQQELNMAVAAATGEDLTDIANRGFSLAWPADSMEPGFESYPEPSVLDWDSVKPVPTALSNLFPECG